MSALDDFINGENEQAESCLMDIGIIPDKYTAIEDAIYRIRNHEHTFGSMSAENLASLMEKELADLRTRIAELENPWQPIETPPETTDHVIVCNKNSQWGGLHFMTMGWYNIELGHWICNTIPTHWMPLPKPPEEK